MCSLTVDTLWEKTNLVGLMFTFELVEAQELLFGQYCELPQSQEHYYSLEKCPNLFCDGYGDLVFIHNLDANMEVSQVIPPKSANLNHGQ